MMALSSARTFCCVASAVVMAACAGRVDSPRAPFARVEPGAPAAGGSSAAAFEVLEDWRWTAAPAAPRVPLTAAALERGRLGLFDARRFRITTGACADCALPEGILSWFRDEVIVVPERRGARIAEPVASAGLSTLPPAWPPLAWIGAPEIIEHAELSRDGATLSVDDAAIDLVVTPRLPTNTAYVNAATAEFFMDRPLRVRGASLDESTFVARTIWPEDARLEFDALSLDALSGNEILGTLVEAQVAAAPAFSSRLLFEKSPGAARDWNGKPVLAIVLSGAQGDDDAARGGHLGVATGVVGPNGEWSDWLVNNFYPLIEQSAKGIIPAPVPMDNYLFDLNSGQLYYRPAYMLVAILRRERAAARAQEALQDMMLELYCGRVEFDFAGFNSTGMAIEPLREVGWRIPRTGPTSRIAGLLAAPIAAIGARSLAAGRDVRKALSQERTSFLPRVAFEALGHDLLYLAYRGDREQDLTAFERALVEDVEAVLFVRLPQVPSARRFGTYPVRSLLTYGAELLADPAPVEFAPETEDRERLRTPVDACAPEGN